MNVGARLWQVIQPGKNYFFNNLTGTAESACF